MEGINRNGRTGKETKGERKREVASRVPNANELIDESRTTDGTRARVAWRIDEDPR